MQQYVNDKTNDHNNGIGVTVGKMKNVQEVRIAMGELLATQR